mmetsp:Transcript_48619/g.150601  ORF Transcript_48619/g.150601 Transcript_48619/m.150601 type:complete len:206 (-) Transcript_48619:1841-2458(-)
MPRVVRSALGGAGGVAEPWLGGLDRRLADHRHPLSTRAWAHGLEEAHFGPRRRPADLRAQAPAGGAPPRGEQPPPAHGLHRLRRRRRHHLRGPARRRGPRRPVWLHGPHAHEGRDPHRGHLPWRRPPQRDLHSPAFKVRQVGAKGWPLPLQGPRAPPRPPSRARTCHGHLGPQWGQRHRAPRLRGGPVGLADAVVVLEGDVVLQA